MIEHLAHAPDGTGPEDHPEDGGEDSRDPADLAIGAFTRDAPWIVDPEAMPWRFADNGEVGIDTLRAQAAALAHTLVRPRHMPSLLRVATVGRYLGGALLGWSRRERGTPASRA